MHNSKKAVEELRVKESRSKLLGFSTPRLWTALCAFFCLLAWTESALGAIAFGAAAVGNNGGGSVSSFTITLSPTTGATVVVGVAIRTTTSTISSITDNGTGGGSTYVKYVSRNGGTNERIETWIAASAAASVTTITVNLTASKVIGCAAYYTGVVAVGNGFDRADTVTTTTPKTVNVMHESGNWSVGMTAAQSTGTFTAGTGSLRTSGVTSGGAAASNVGGSLQDSNGSAVSAGTLVTLNPTISAAELTAGAAIELRSAAPSGSIAHIRGQSSSNWAPTTSAAETEIHQVTSGDLLIVTVEGYVNTGTISSVTDSNGTVSTAVANVNNNPLNMATFYVKNAAAGTHQFTPSFGATTRNDIIVDEYKGLDTLDQTSSNQGTSTSADSLSKTTTQANELIYGTVNANADADTITPTSTGDVKTGSTEVAGGTSSPPLESQGHVVSVTASYNETATISTSVVWIDIMSTWYQSAGPPHQLPTLGVGANLVPPCPAIPCSIDLNFQNLCSATFNTSCVGGLQISHIDPVNGTKVIDASVLLPLAATYTVDAVGKDANGNAVVDPPTALLVTLRPPT